MSEIAENIQRIKAELPSGVDLVAVSKFKPVSCIREALSAGQRIFGESRPQELKAKAEELAGEDLHWHFIGHLQTNKIKMVVPYADLIHSVDSERLFYEIARYCRDKDMQTAVLIEVHIATEESKQGFSTAECIAFIEQLREVWLAGRAAVTGIDRISLRGLMAMASLTEDERLIRSEFGRLEELFASIKRLDYPFLSDFSLKSYGMTGDYRIAVETGSNMVRIGTAIFGSRTTY